MYQGEVKTNYIPKDEKYRGQKMVTVIDKKSGKRSLAPEELARKVQKKGTHKITDD